MKNNGYAYSQYYITCISVRVKCFKDKIIKKIQIQIFGIFQFELKPI